MSATIEVTRGSIASRSPGNRRPISNYYECEGPDGRKFTNTSIATLRTVLRERYGRDVVIVEPWKIEPLVAVGDEHVAREMCGDAAVDAFFAARGVDPDAAREEAI